MMESPQLTVHKYLIRSFAVKPDTKRRHICSHFESPSENQEYHSENCHRDMFIMLIAYQIQCFIYAHSIRSHASELEQPPVMLGGVIFKKNVFCNLKKIAFRKRILQICGVQHRTKTREGLFSSGERWRRNDSNNNEASGFTLGEPGTLARLLETCLLPFDHAGVSRQQAF